MRIVCDLCQTPLNVPDGKIPDRPFTMTCPVCKGRFHVDPAALGAAPPPSWNGGDDTVDAGLSRHPPAGSSAPPQAAFAPSPQAAPSPALAPNASHAISELSGPIRQRSPHDTGSLTRITPLPPAEQKLLDRVTPVAFVVCLDGRPMPEITEQLQLIGLDEVRHFTDLQEACEEAMETEIGVLVIKMEKAAPPPCEPLTPVHRLPAETRRRTFTALIAENVRSLDGQVAFFLQVNCVLSSTELESLPVKLRRALLHHQKAYRYWAAED